MFTEYDPAKQYRFWSKRACGALTFLFHALSMTTSHNLNAAAHAETFDAEWPVPVFPNGDYYIFARPDFSTGTFGHPWEKTLCVFGSELVQTLGRTLATWLPRKRENGDPLPG